MKKTLAAATAAMIPLALATAASAVASPDAGRTTMDVTCGDPVGTVTVTTAGGSDGNNWGAAQVSGGGHLVLAALEYRVDDVTAGVPLDDEVLANGRAHEQQQTIVCEVATEETTLRDVAPDGFDYQGTGTAPEDTVAMSLHVTVVPRP